MKNKKGKVAFSSSADSSKDVTAVMRWTKRNVNLFDKRILCEFVNTVTNLQVPQKAVKFLTS